MTGIYNNQSYRFICVFVNSSAESAKLPTRDVQGEFTATSFRDHGRVECQLVGYEGR